MTCRWKDRKNLQEYCCTCSWGSRFGCQLKSDHNSPECSIRPGTHRLLRGKPPGAIKAFRMCGKEYPVHASTAGVFPSCGLSWSIRKMNSSSIPSRSKQKAMHSGLSTTGKKRNGKGSIRSSGSWCMAGPVGSWIRKNRYRYRLSMPANVLTLRRYIHDRDHPGHDHDPKYLHARPARTQDI